MVGRVDAHRLGVGIGQLWIVLAARFRRAGDRKSFFMCRPALLAARCSSPQHQRRPLSRSHNHLSAQNFMIFFSMIILLIKCRGLTRALVTPSGGRAPNTARRSGSLPLSPS